MEKITFSQAITGYELDANARHLSPHTIKDYQNTFARFQEFLKDDPPFREITAQVIREFLATRTVSKKTTLNYHTGLSALWNWAENAGLVDINIVRAIQRPKPEKRVIEELQKEQVEAMLNAIDRSRPFAHRGQRECDVALPNADRNRAILLLLLDTGIRVSELCDLAINRCDLKSRKIIVFGKGSKERMIPISARTAQVIWRYLQTRKDARLNDLLFVTRDDLPMTRKNVLDTLEDIGDRPEFPGFTRTGYDIPLQLIICVMEGMFLPSKTP